MNIAEIIREFRNRNSKTKLKIAVLGDTLIDEYRYGHVNRVSPEFPVPILTSETDAKERYPGGGANVCHQMTHMNTNVFYIGLVDSPTLDLLNDFHINTDYSVRLTNGSVPIKIRFYDNDFPLLRWDIEKSKYGELELEKLQLKIINNFQKLAEQGLNFE